MTHKLPSDFPVPLCSPKMVSKRLINALLLFTQVGIYQQNALTLQYLEVSTALEKSVTLVIYILIKSPFTVTQT